MRRTFAKLFAPTAAMRCHASNGHLPLTSFSEDEQALVDSVREFALKEIKPKTKSMDENSKLCPELLKELFANGYMGIETDAKYQGSGMSFFASILAIEQLARVDPGVAVTVDVQNTLVNNIFFRFANEDICSRFLPKLAQGTVGCFCLTEASSGSDAFALKTKAEKKGDNYILNGTKHFITNGGDAGIFLVMANVDPSKGYKGITCFAVDASESPGVSIGGLEKKLGIKASSTATLNFDNVVVPAKNVVGEVGKGYKIAIETLNEGRIGIAGQMVGIAQGAMDVAMPYLFERKQFNTLIGDFQGMQFQYAQANLDIQAARLLTYNAGRKKMAGLPFVEDAAMAKLFASQVAERVASKAIEWCGGVGFSREFGVERFYRDAKIGAIYEGTTNIQLHTLAKFVKEQYGGKK